MSRVVIRLKFCQGNELRADVVKYRQWKPVDRWRMEAPTRLAD